MKISNLIRPNNSIVDALKRLDESALKLLVVVDEHNKLLGTCSDGDIRRLLLKGNALDSSIEFGYFKNSKFIRDSEFSEKKAFEICNKYHVLGLPVVDSNLIVKGFYSLNRGVASQTQQKIVLSQLPVIIMGGGKGTRLKPISDVFPKPLIPIKGKPMVNHVIDYFKSYGLNDFYLTLNYKADLIKAYFSSEENNNKITFIEEPTFMGTAGSLSLLKEYLNGDFIISNCDCLVKIDIPDAIRQHKENSTDLTVITSIQNHQVPYGVIEYENGGRITKIDEKPMLSFPMNTGVYIANSSVLEFIKQDGLFHMTDLIDVLIENNKKVSCYFISEKEFIDFGQWDEYTKALNLIQ